MKKVLIRVMCVIVLIPVLGIGIPFGGGWVYGQIRHAEKKAKAVRILDDHESTLKDAAEKKTGSAEDTGVKETERGKGYVLFEMPYEAKIGSWVPCGLMFASDEETIPNWIKHERIRDEWYFYWEPS